MRLQLDTKEKVIRLEESVNLAEFFENIKKLLHDGSWEEYRLETNCTINWTTPIVVKEYPYWPTYPWITYGPDAPTIINSTTEGIYNIEI
jgi:hypothetical protein